MNAAAKSGVDGTRLAREVGVTPERLASSIEPLPYTSEEALWRTLARHTDDSAFGLRAARSMERGALRGVEYAMRSSATVGDALGLLPRFSRLLHRERRYGVRHEVDGSATLVYESPHSVPVGSMITDFALALVVAICRDAAHPLWAPSMVCLRHRPSVELDRYRGFFQAPMQFDAPENALVIEPARLDAPMREADPILCTVLEQYLRSELEAIDPAQSLEDAVRSAIARALPEQNADLETIAERVSLSSRVLQKRLQQANTSFQELLDRVREGQAKRCLLQPRVSLAGTALELGYSDVTAFHRAFKRWTGLTPGEFRRRAGRESATV